MRVADTGSDGGIRDGADNIRLNGVHPREFFAHRLAAQVHAPTFQDGVGA